MTSPIDFDTLPLSANVSDLPPHFPRALTAAEREALLPLVWETNPNYPIRASVTEEGCWKIIGPSNYGQPGTSSHQPCRVEFRPPPPEGETFESLLMKSPAYGLTQVGAWREVALKHGNELGYVVNPDAAERVIEALRRAPVSGDEKTFLGEAGFTFAHRMASMNGVASEVDVFYKEDARGSFSLFRSNHCVHLTRERKGGGTSWLNLLRLARACTLQDERLAPLFWPDTVADPMASAVFATVDLLQYWQPEPKAKSSRPSMSAR